MTVASLIPTRLQSSLVRRATSSNARSTRAVSTSSDRLQKTPLSTSAIVQSPGVMLKRATQDYEVKGPPTTSRNELSKQLFPSSSPGSSQSNIMDSLKRSSQPKPLAAQASVSARTNNPHTNTASATRPSSVATLCNKSNSFHEDSDQVVVTGSRSKPAPAVYFDENDFSDDENLDLDFEQPASMPSQTKPAPPRPLQEAHNPPEPPQPTQAIPWSSSPASHMEPPSHDLGKRPPFNASSSKRPSQDATATDQQQPKKRRGKLPDSFANREVINLEDDSSVPPHDATPASKPSKGPLPWDTTQSAVKAQKKQHKDQFKKPAPGDYSADDMKHIVGATKSDSSNAISLSAEQQRVQDLVVSKGQSVFFTGPAGTGKSVLMRSIISQLKKKFARDPERLAVTASTGLAACNIGGITLHSFSGIGLGKEDLQTLVKKIRRNPKAKNRWLRTKVLIIDEISMVDGELFDKLSAIGRTLRNNGRPWGGIQLVITGDFFQLPPVPDNGGDRSQPRKEAKFAFDAATWNTSVDHTIGLTQVFRQKDPVFANMLNEMRLGRITDDTVKTFKSMARPIGQDDIGIDTTELFPTRFEVENANQTRLRQLPGKLRKYDSHDTGEPQIRDKLLQNMMAPKSLELKEGAQVMLVKNMDDTLVNGSVGKVKAFMSEALFEIKSEQGFCEDGYASDDKSNAQKARLKNRIQAFTKEYEEAKKGTAEYPVVEFGATNGIRRTILCVPEDWKVELPTGEVQASRSQVPLILAWALSIHKAQGQTLERVKVDLGKVFEKGQAYVALSRATSQQGLQVMRFEKHKVMAHPRVVQFYNQLYSVDQAETKKPVTVTSYAPTRGPVKNPPPKQNGVMTSFLQRGNNKGASPQQDEEEAMMAAHGY